MEIPDLSQVRVGAVPEENDTSWGLLNGRCGEPTSKGTGRGKVAGQRAITAWCIK